MQELWIVKDDTTNKRWEFICKTMYDIQITKNTNKRIERTYFIPYDEIWKIFGVDISVCDYSDIKMFASMLLDTMFLEMPTINMGRNKNDDSDTEEEIHIKLRDFNIVCHQRHVVDIEGVAMPITMSLIGNHEKYFGIKAVVYNRMKRKEDGIFLRVFGKRTDFNF